MTLEEECRLSYYREIAVLNEEHRVSLVQHGESGRIYVKKVLSVKNLEVGYDEPVAKVSFELFRGEKLGIIGENE